MTALTHIDTTPSDNDYTLHHTLEINGVNGPSGMFLVSEVDYKQFEGELTSGRWVMRERTYLWSYRRHLLDQSSLRAKLSPLLKPFRGKNGKLIIIDDIIIDDDKPLTKDGFESLMCSARLEFASKSDFMCSLAWRKMASRLGLSESNFLSSLGPYKGTAVTRDLAVGAIPLLGEYPNEKSNYNPSYY